MSETKDVELFEKLESHAIRVKSICDHCTNEEQTKISLINPYLELIGFEVRDPRHVRLEHRANIHKGTERVDYALLQDGNPYILVEAKSADKTLPESASNQILRYAMSVPSVRYVVMTNGVIWNWFAKLPGVQGLPELQARPFLSHDTSNPSQRELTWLHSLREDSADLAEIAMQEGYRGKIVDWISRQRTEPDENLIKVLAQVVGERRTSRVARVLEDMWPKTFSQFIRTEVDRALGRARVSDDEVTRAAGSAAASPSYQGTPPNSVLTDSDSEAASNGVHGQREFRTIKGTVLLKASEQRKAWRPRNQAYWRVAPSAQGLFVEILKYLSAQHDAGPQAFYESLANSPIRAFRRISDVPLPNRHFGEVVPGWYLKRQNTKNSLRCLKQLARMCVKGGQPVNLDSQFELWLPVATQDPQSESTD